MDAPASVVETRPAARASVWHASSLTATSSGESGSGVGSDTPHTYTSPSGAGEDLRIEVVAVRRAVVHEERVRGHAGRVQRDAEALESTHFRHRQLAADAIGP